ncbi:hypothetical protein [Vibrio nigripulchritudo]|uniref:hypothetical protein n=1 Tax=Vibrio nigripulchritudo TaxID=28173 RepID=UPI0003B1A855|nr:hypothetical protein [Vibrio nigripulchritudo]CCN72910.1 conserved hypothetical protein [Vibrio nigripulchritudo SFn118]
MKAFPNIKQPKGSLYCGPYCTAACLHAFELLPLKSPKKLSRYAHAEKAFNGESIELTEELGLEAIALEFYKVVGIVTKGENPTYIEHSGYSSLAAMLYVLGEFDLNTELVVSNSARLSYLKSVYPTEFELIDKLNVPICILDDEPSTPNGTILISLILDPGSPHYIINNSRGEWLDTNIEENSPSWDFIEKWGETDKKYKDSTWVGISIRVRR